ncbi:MAG: mannose-1-phosphate guanylyltransferase [Oscillospiraceae bacterium]|jgi:mannose-1-phosphate guanylyltransferase|nr:mannose-1-phosphate guanylyltransferase [Oscillospiraceae bacterium]
MQIILLSGGSGKRLWPLSNNDRPKQFLKVLPSPSGRCESMVQRVYRQLGESGIGGEVTIATGESQVPLIREQLGCEVDIVREPSRRDTFPAIALSCLYLRYEKNAADDEIVAVLPIDPYCELSYFYTIQKMEQLAKRDFAEIMLMGVTPDFPSEKFGYIVPDGKTLPAKVARFVEKPPREQAVMLTGGGALWNGGVFVFKLGYMLNIVRRNVAVSSFGEALSRYGEFTKTSFDYAVVEKAESVGVVQYNGYWEDLGTWGALVDLMENPAIGKATMGEGTSGTQIINELGIPVIALGVKDLVIVASREGILVTGKSESSHLKEYVE